MQAGAPSLADRPARHGPRPEALARLWRLAALPAVAIFVSANVANAGNLVFNLLFSRWMGPAMFADLATLLTLKLSLLAVLNAVQMAVSAEAASPRDGEAGFAAGMAWLNRAAFVALGLALPVVLPAALTGAVTAALGLTDGAGLAILLLALPVTLPLCLARGVAIGRIETARIVLSANLEMLVRLAGAILLWQAGHGLAGVAAAIALSILAGWLPVRASVTGPADRAAAFGLAPRIGRLALPFAALQAAQVALLDGDILAARALLDAEQSGMVAVLGLAQRIQFYACFALAGFALSSVTRGRDAGPNGLRGLRPVAVLVAAVNLPAVALAALAPQALIAGLAGQAYAAAAPVLWMAALSAFLFTLSYMAATVLAAFEDRRGIWMITAAVPVQILAFASLVHLPDPALADLLAAKTGVQAGLTTGLAILLYRRLRRHPS